MVNVTVKNKTDWAISSQAAKGLVDGSTIRLWSPERTVKAHERGGTTMEKASKKKSGVYAIRHNNGTYYGSSHNIHGRFAQHRTDLRLGKHANRNLQKVFFLDGFGGLSFEIVELCEDRSLIDLEKKHIRESTTPVFNIIAPNGSSRKHCAASISKTLKAKYANDPEALDRARKALDRARNSEAMKANKHTPEANKLRASSVGADWQNMTAEEKKRRGSSISAGMKKEIPAVCGHCEVSFTATTHRQKWCSPKCRVDGFYAKKKKQAS